MFMKPVARFFFVFALTAAAPALADGWPTVETAARQAYMIDANTGTVLFDKDGETHMPTSSMSKIMTAYLVFEAIQNGQLSLEQTVPVSERAWRMQGSKMFVHVGDQVKVEDLIRGMIIQSGNDACVVLAEAVAGSEESFARKMTERAKELGLTDSHFANATGWPDPDHYSTPKDLTTLAQRLMKDFPQYYHYYSEKDFDYGGINQGNRNPLLYTMNGADGVKTGHTDIAGYGLIGSAQRDGRRLIMVINGTDSMQARADESRKILEWGFSQFHDVNVAEAGKIVDKLPVWYGEAADVDVVSPETVQMTLPYGTNATAKITGQTPVAAPISKGQEIAQLVISVPGQPDKSYKLVAANDVPKLGFWGRIGRKLGM